MPLYEYYCPPCGTQFEVLRPISQMDEAAVCPSGHTTNNRVLSLFAISRAMGDSPISNAMACGADDCCAVDGMAAMGHGGACSCC